MPWLGWQDLRGQPCCRHALELVTTTVREDARRGFAHVDWPCRHAQRPPTGARLVAHSVAHRVTGAKRCTSGNQAALGGRRGVPDEEVDGGFGRGCVKRFMGRLLVVPCMFAGMWCPTSSVSWLSVAGQHWVRTSGFSVSSLPAASWRGACAGSWGSAFLLALHGASSPVGGRR